MCSNPNDVGSYVEEKKLRNMYTQNISYTMSCPILFRKISLLICALFLFLTNLSLANAKNEINSTTVPEWDKLWERSQSGDCNALYLLLSNYWQPNLKEQGLSHKSENTKLKELERDAQAGSADACYLLAVYYFHVDIDHEKSKNHFNHGAELGNAECMMVVGNGMLFNDLAAQKEEQIRDLLLRAAKAGKADAYASLALMYLWLGEHGMDKSKALEQSEQYIQKAEEADSAMIWSVKGDMYRTGMGRSHNRREAIRCYQIGAQKGDPKAQYVYGRYCFGSPDTASEGIKLLGKSAARLNISAISSLGFIYLNGFKVPQDVKKGFLFIQYAAYHGDAIAQFQLGQILYEGRFIAKNEELGLEWIQKAACQGCQPAMQYLKQLQDH